MHLLAAVALIASTLAAAPPAAAAETCHASWFRHAPHEKKFAGGPLYVAHKSAPKGSYLVVTAPSGKSVRVQVRDRGPYIAGRCVDLSPAAFVRVADRGLGQGVVRNVQVR